tara:strand:+ start:29 stop:316 length:288 start_codon:yes stop_codon:yes gene_type:complete
MIIAKIAKAVLKLIMPDVTEHLLKVFKLDRVVDYMELPNEADRGVLKLQDELNMIKGQLKDMVKDAHPPAIDLKEWDDVKDTIRKVKNMKKFKIG